MLRFTSPLSVKQTIQYPRLPYSWAACISRITCTMHSLQPGARKLYWKKLVQETKSGMQVSCVILVQIS